MSNRKLSKQQIKTIMEQYRNSIEEKTYADQITHRYSEAFFHDLYFNLASSLEKKKRRTARRFAGIAAAMSVVILTVSLIFTQNIVNDKNNIEKFSSNSYIGELPDDKKILIDNDLVLAYSIEYNGLEPSAIICTKNYELLNIDIESYLVSTYELNGCSVDLYIPRDESCPKELVWKDDSGLIWDISSKDSIQNLFSIAGKTGIIGQNP